MNERIKELAEQCVTRKFYVDHASEEFDYGKFAELMVAEFQNILRDNRGEDTGTLSYRVEEHFRS